MTNQYLKKIDPLEAFIGYILDTKPYHTKILEVLEEYIHTELVDLTITDEHIFGDPRCIIIPPPEGATQSGYTAYYDPEKGYVWNSTDECQYKGIELFYPKERLPYHPCLSGFSAHVWGAPGEILINTPNKAVSFHDYPAIDSDNNSFIVNGSILGDMTDTFIPGHKVSITVKIEDYCNSFDVIPEPDPEPPNLEPIKIDLILKKKTFSINDGQTSFDTTNVFTCPVGNMFVFVNGVKLSSSEYTQTSIGKFTLNNGILFGDILEAQSWVPVGNINFERQTQKFVANKGDTTFVADEEHPIGHMKVYFNGVKLSRSAYTQSSLTNVSLAQPVETDGDIVEIESWVSNNTSIPIKVERLKGDTTNQKDKTVFATEEDSNNVYLNGGNLVEGTDYTVFPGGFTLTNPIQSNDDVISIESLVMFTVVETTTASTEFVIINTPASIQTTNYWTVAGNRANYFATEFVFYGDGIDYRQKYYTISSIYVPAEDITRVFVYPEISPKDRENVRKIGIQIHQVTELTGSYTIKSSTFVQGTLDEWPDIRDDTTYINGSDEHTLIEVEEALAPLPTLTDPSCQTLTGVATPEVIPVQSVLHYSNYLRRGALWDAPRYGESPPLCSPEFDPSCVVDYVEQTPDEGYFCTKLLTANPNTSVFEVQGLLDASNIFVGTVFRIENSKKNAGYYTITGIVYNRSTETTSITVNETITTDHVECGEPYGSPPCDVDAPGCETMYCSYDSDSCKDFARFQIPANVIIVDGDYTKRFVQGKKFLIDGGTLSGEYITYSSRLVNGQTHIRTVTTILDNNQAGYSILGANQYTGGLFTIIVEGDKTEQFPAGMYFNIIDSKSNDGFFQVAEPGATLICDDNVCDDQKICESPEGRGLKNTEIPVLSYFEDSPTGKIIPFKPGVIKEKFYGYGEYNEWCDNIPSTFVNLSVNEHIDINGAVIELGEEVIVYNVENKDRLGYELSFATAFAVDPPTVHIGDTEPTDGSYFWFDTSTSTDPVDKFQSIDRLHRQVNNNGTLEWVSTHTDNVMWWVKIEVPGPESVSTAPVLYKELYYKKMQYTQTSSPVFSQTDWIADTPKSKEMVSGAGTNVTQDPEDPFRSPATPWNLDKPWWDNEDVSSRPLVYPITPGYNLILPGRGLDKILKSGSFLVEPLPDFVTPKNTYELIDEKGNPIPIERDPYNVDPTTGVPKEPKPDRSLIKIWVNGNPALWCFDKVTPLGTSPETFHVTVKILKPRLNIGDIIYFEIHGREGEEYQHNAHVYSFDRLPHTFFHANVGIVLPAEDPQLHGAYIVGGGNFLKKFRVTTEFTTHSITPTNSIVNIERAKEFPIEMINRVTNELIIDGDYTWLFKEGRIILAQPSEYTHSRYMVSRSLAAAGKTAIEVISLDNGASPYMMTDDPLLFDEPTPVIEIDKNTDTIIVDCDRRDSIFPGDTIQIINSSANNDGVYIINQVTYDFALDRTDLRVFEDIPDSEVSPPSSVQVYLPVYVNDKTKVITGAVYEPKPTEVYDHLDQYGNDVTSISDVTYIVPVNEVDPTVRKIDYRYEGPVRIDTEYGILNDLLDVEFEIVKPDTIKVYFHGKTHDRDRSEPTAYDFVTLADSMKPGDIFKLKYSGGISQCVANSNDGYYVIKEITDDGGDPPITTIKIETDYSVLPPIRDSVDRKDFTVISSNPSVPGIGGEIEFYGDVTRDLKSMTSKRFYLVDSLSRPLIDIIFEKNVATISSIDYNSTDDKTTLQILEPLIRTINADEEVFIVDYAFNPAIFASDEIITIPSLKRSKSENNSLGGTDVAIGYDKDNLKEVYLNGVLVSKSDYTATSGTIITFATPTISGDIVTAVSFREDTVNQWGFLRDEWIASDGDTTFPFTYDPGDVDVFVNGVLLPTGEYTATTGTNIVLDNPTELDDTVVAISYEDATVNNLDIIEHQVTDETSAPYVFPYSPGYVNAYVNGILLHRDDYDDSTGDEISFTPPPPHSTDVVSATFFLVGNGISVGPGLWSSGILVWEGHSLDFNFSSEPKTAKATITESLSFDWDGYTKPFSFDIKLLDPVRNIIIPSKDFTPLQMGQKIKITGTVNNNKTFTVKDIFYFEDIPYIRVQEQLAYGTFEIDEVIDAKTIKFHGSTRGKIKKGEEVFINKNRHLVEKVSYKKPITTITLKNPIDSKKKIKSIWFKERTGKVKDKTS